MEDHKCTVVEAVQDQGDNSTVGDIDEAALAPVDSRTVDTGGGRGPAMAGSCRAQRWATAQEQEVLLVGCSSTTADHPRMSFDWCDRRRTAARRLDQSSSQSLAVEGDTGSHLEA